MQTKKITIELTEKEQIIFLLRNGGASMTLEEVGKRFHVTRERIRQIEQRMFAKIAYELRDVVIPK